MISVDTGQPKPIKIYKPSYITFLGENAGQERIALKTMK